MKQIITIKGTPIETYDDSVIQLDYKSNILGEIDKIEACHSYTYEIPNTTKNKALFRLSDVLKFLLWHLELFLKGSCLLHHKYLHYEQCLYLVHNF